MGSTLFQVEQIREARFFLRQIFDFFTHRKLFFIFFFGGGGGGGGRVDEDRRISNYIDNINERKIVTKLKKDI